MRIALMMETPSEQEEYMHDDMTDEDDPHSHSHGDFSWPKFQGTPEDYLEQMQDVLGPHEQLLELERVNIKNHLMSIHGLKTLQITRPRVERAKNWDSKARWRPNSNLIARPSYAAWPEEPMLVSRDTEQFENVPRSALTFRGQAGTSGRSKLGEEFNDEVVAEVQRQVREQFNRQEAAANDKFHGSARREDLGSLPTGQSAQPSDQSMPPAVYNSLEGHEESSNGKENSPEEANNSQDSLNVPTFVRSTQKSSKLASIGDLQPSIMLDEDKTKVSAQPIVHSIIQTTDKLLCGLARMRRNHIEPNAYESSREGSVNNDSPRASPDLVLGASNSTTSGTKSGSEYQSRYIRQLETMDWSEVLGMSSLVGFDTKVVARAHQRCETILQETMRFHPVREHEKDCKGYGNRENLWLGGETTAADEQTSLNNGTATRLSPHLPGPERTFHCPEIICERFNRSFRSITALSAHVQKMHGYLYELGPPRAKSNLPEWMVELRELCCPFESCEHHTKHFPSNWRLMEHMKRRHRVEPRKISAKRRKNYTSRRNRKLLMSSKEPDRTAVDPHESMSV